MPIITWVCEQCERKQEGGMRPPQGWNELSYWNAPKGMFIRHSFCSYRCAGQWCQGRYDEPRENER